MSRVGYSCYATWMSGRLTPLHSSTGKLVFRPCSCRPSSKPLQEVDLPRKRQSNTSSLISCMYVRINLYLKIMMYVCIYCIYARLYLYISVKWYPTVYNVWKFVCMYVSMYVTVSHPYWMYGPQQPRWGTRAGLGCGRWPGERSVGSWSTRTPPTPTRNFDFETVCTLILIVQSWIYKLCRHTYIHT